MLPPLGVNFYGRITAFFGSRRFTATAVPWRLPLLLTVVVTIMALETEGSGKSLFTPQGIGNNR